MPCLNDTAINSAKQALAVLDQRTFQTLPNVSAGIGSDRIRVSYGDRDRIGGSSVIDRAVQPVSSNRRDHAGRIDAANAVVGFISDIKIADRVDRQVLRGGQLRLRCGSACDSADDPSRSG